MPRERACEERVGVRVESLTAIFKCRQEYKGRGKTRAGGALYIRFAFNIPSQEDEFNVESLDGTYTSTLSLRPLSIV